MAKRKIHPGTIRILCQLAVMVTLLVVLLVLIGKVWLDMGAQPEETEPVEQTAGTSATEQTEPLDTSPDGLYAAFMESNGLTEADYPAWFPEALELSGENLDFLLNYPYRYGVPQTVDISDVSRDTVPLFIQWDDRWGYLDYNGNVCGISGCGPTCLSMVAYYLTGKAEYTPSYMIAFATENRYAVPGSGTDWSLMSAGAKKLGLESEVLPAVESRVAARLKAGIPVIASVKPGVFTQVGHYIVLVGYEDGKFRVNDPNSYERSARLWAWEEFIGDVRNFWAISLPEE